METTSELTDTGNDRAEAQLTSCTEEAPRPWGKTPPVLRHVTENKLCQEVGSPKARTHSAVPSDKRDIVLATRPTKPHW